MTETKSAVAELRELADELDQQRSVARDLRNRPELAIGHEIQETLAIAWYFAETALREHGQASCEHGVGEDKFNCYTLLNAHPSCQVCQQFAALDNRAKNVARCL